LLAGDPSSSAIDGLPVEPALQSLRVLRVASLEVPPEALQGGVARGPGDLAIVTRDRREATLPLADQVDDVRRQDVRVAPRARLRVNCI
jgi:hypothetical protein